MRRMGRDEFGLLFDVFLTIKSDYFLKYWQPIWESERTVCNLVKQEAEDVLLPFARDKADRKIKREIFKRHYEAAKGALHDRDSIAARGYFLDAVVEGYGFFYGSQFVELLFEDTSVIRSSVEHGDFKSLEDMLVASPEKNFMYLASKEGALGRFLNKGYISV